jgi:hyperosmotically inducible periplasmic protein
MGFEVYLLFNQEVQMKLTRLSKLIRTAGLMLGTLSIAAAASAQAATRKAPDTLNDAWITTQIYAKFFADADIKARNIDVDTTGGVFTLTGEVHSATEKTQAIAKARGTDGVTQVVDKLTLTPGGRPMSAEVRDKAAAARDKAAADWPKRKEQAKSAADRIGKEISDTWITTKVQSMYFLDREVKGMDIDVTTNAGVVTLAGAVDSDAARKKAIADANSIEGVKQVVDKLVVKR